MIARGWRATLAQSNVISGNFSGLLMNKISRAKCYKSSQEPGVFVFRIISQQSFFPLKSFEDPSGRINADKSIFYRVILIITFFRDRRVCVSPLLKSYCFLYFTHSSSFRSKVFQRQRELFASLSTDVSRIIPFSVSLSPSMNAYLLPLPRKNILLPLF